MNTGPGPTRLAIARPPPKSVIATRRPLVRPTRAILSHSRTFVRVRGHSSWRSSSHQGPRVRKTGSGRDLSQCRRGFTGQIVSARGDSAVDRQSALACHDFAAGAACGGVGPGTGMLVEFEERWQAPRSCIASNRDCRSGPRTGRTAPRRRGCSQGRLASSPADAPSARRGRVVDDKGGFPRSFPHPRMTAGTSARP